MGRFTGPKNKIARRFGVDLGLKSNPAKVSRRLTQAPGVHGEKRRQTANSSFGKQLLEKQKAKFMYGIRERQLRGYVTEATRKTGDSGITLKRLLEKRLDNTVYRLGFAITRAQARQMVGHGMFTVNGKKQNIPSHQVSANDVIELKSNKAGKKLFDNVSERLENATLPSWLSLDVAKKSGKVLGEPAEGDLEKIFDVKLIIEYYSSR